MFLGSHVVSFVCLFVCLFLCFCAPSFRGFLFFTECVLGCSWENGQPVCVGEGFHLVSIVSNEVTFEIPSHKPGMFFCDTLPSDRKDTGLYCNFTLKGKIIFYYLLINRSPCLTSLQ